MRCSTLSLILPLNRCGRWLASMLILSHLPCPPSLCVTLTYNYTVPYVTQDCTTKTSADVLCSEHWACSIWSHRWLTCVVQQYSCFLLYFAHGNFLGSNYFKYTAPNVFLCMCVNFRMSCHSTKWTKFDPTKTRILILTLIAFSLCLQVYRWFQWGPAEGSVCGGWDDSSEERGRGAGSRGLHGRWESVAYVVKCFSENLSWLGS